MTGVRPIAVASAKRSPALPDVKTIAEQGVEGVISESWQGLFFPAGTPKEIVAQVQKEVAAALKDPEVIKRLANFGSEPIGSTSEEFTALVKSDIAKYAVLVKEANIPLQ